MKESRYTCVLVFEAAMGRELDTVEQSGRSELGGTILQVLQVYLSQLLTH